MLGSPVLFLNRLLTLSILLFFSTFFQLTGQSSDSVSDPNWLLDRSLTLPYNQLDSSISLAKKASKLSNPNQKRIRLRSFDLLSTFYLEKGELDSSLIHAYKALELAKSYSNDTLLASAYNGLEVVYFEMGEMNKSKEYADKLLQLAIEKDLERYRFEAYWSLGMIHSSLYNDSLLTQSERDSYYRKSKDYYHKSLSEVKIDRLDSVDILNSLAILEADRGNYKQAIEYMIEVVGHYEEEGSVVGLANVHNNLGYTYFEMGEMEKANEHLDEAWNLVKDLPLWIERAYISESLQEFHEQLGNTEQAYFFLKQNTQAEKKLSNNRMEANLGLIESRYQNRVLEAENARSEQQLENQYLIISLGIIVLLSLIIILGILYFAKKKQDELIRTIQENNKKLEELNQFKDQMLSVISHDFKGPLNNLQLAISLAREEDLSANEYKTILQGVDGQLVRTQIFLENILFWARNQVKGYSVEHVEFKMDKLVEESENLLSPQINDKDLMIKKSYDPSVNINSDREIVNIVFRNIFQNAIKYSREKECIVINYFERNGKRIISVMDSGVGMDKEVIDNLFTYQVESTVGTQLERGAGIGLLLSKELLELIDGKIEVYSVKKQGSEFQIILS